MNDHKETLTWKHFLKKSGDSWMNRPQYGYGSFIDTVVTTETRIVSPLVHFCNCINNSTSCFNGQKSVQISGQKETSVWEFGNLRVLTLCHDYPWNLHDHFRTRFDQQITAIVTENFYQNICSKLKISWLFYDFCHLIKKKVHDSSRIRNRKWGFTTFLWLFWAVESL